jgi:beta-lactamase class A
MKAANAVIFALLFSLVLAGCGAREQIPNEAPAAIAASKGSALAPLPKLDLRHDTSLESQIAEIASQAQGRVGVSAVLLETGDAAELNADAQFPMQSVYKLPIAMAVGHASSVGKLSLGQQVNVRPSDFVRLGVRSPIRNQFPQGGVFTIRELLAQAISESDGTASDVLLEQAGGPAGVMDYLSKLGVDQMFVKDSEKDTFKDWDTQYRNSASPRATVELLRQLQFGGGIAADTRQELLYLMKSSVPGWRRIRHYLPKDVEVAHKTGTGGTNSVDANTTDTNTGVKTSAAPTPPIVPRVKPSPSPTGSPQIISSATNDVGIIYLPNGKHILIAVYVSDSTAPAFVREGTIAQIAKAVWNRWSGQ